MTTMPDQSALTDDPSSRFPDPARHPTLSGVERPFFDYWIANVVDPRDRHLSRWIDYEETAVARADATVDELERRHPIDAVDVLDVGCQNGAKLVALARRGARSHGIDVEARAVKAAAVRAAAWEVEVDARAGNACALDFPDDRFDIVCSTDVLEHVPDKLAMLDEITRVLRPGGLLALAAPQRFSLKHLLRDPHYQHPGLSILPARAATWANRRVFGESVYEVETLPTRTWTCRQLQKRGLRLLDPPGAGARGLLRRGVDELRQGFELYAVKTDPR